MSWLCAVAGCDSRSDKEPGVGTAAAVEAGAAAFNVCFVLHSDKRSCVMFSVGVGLYCLKIDDSANIIQLKQMCISSFIKSLCCFVLISGAFGNCFLCGI